MNMMEYTRKGNKVTGQGPGSPEPVGLGSVREGFHRSSSYDFSEICVLTQAQSQETATGSELERANLFARSNKISRSPVKKKANIAVSQNS